MQREVVFSLVDAAFAQRQNDVYGALLDSVYIHAKVQDHLPHELWEALCRQVEAAVSVWEKPDQGIWEARGKPQHYVSSKLMCWVALDRGCRLADRIGEEDRLGRWTEVAEKIRADILDKGVSDRGVHNAHPIAAGKTASFTVKFPSAGTYRFYCAIKGHAAKGMQMNVKVT